ncbi:MAG: hypothetical protein QM581_04980 [Pseudomonas sp.]
MSSLSPRADDRSWPAMRAVRWCADVLRMFRRAPLRFYLLPLLPLAVEAAIQAIPFAGVVLSKLLVPLCSAWVLWIGDRKLRTGRFSPRAGLVALARRPRALIVVALLSAGVFVFQCLVAMSLAGPEQALAFARGDLGGLHMGRGMVAIVLASGVPPSLLLLFSVPRMLLDAQPLRPAWQENLRLLRRGWRPVLVYAVLCAALVAGFVFLPWLLLLVPLLGWFGYAAYRDVFTGRDWPGA